MQLTRPVCVVEGMTKESVGINASFPKRLIVSSMPCSKFVIFPSSAFIGGCSGFVRAGPRRALCQSLLKGRAKAGPTR